MIDADPMAVPKFWVAVIGLGASLTAAGLAIQSYRRGQQWKRAEFLAGEMKNLFADERVQKALLMIDWGVRRINLFDSNHDASGPVVVTREMQIRALRPHILLQPDGSDVEIAENTEAEYYQRFSPAEAAIRDCYDAFLDGLERFSSYVESNLIDVLALRPYIEYWIDDIHAATSNHLDAAWTAALLTYISFYRFDGVIYLFNKLNRDISPTSSAFVDFLQKMEDQSLAGQLARSVGVQYP